MTKNKRFLVCIQQINQKMTQITGSPSSMIYTAMGLKSDIETLFSKYNAMNTTKFVVFTQCFKDINFGLIFRGRHNDNEMHEFIDEVYLEVLSHLVNRDKPVSHRICSLYLLYAVYVKQPLDQSLTRRLDIKIRITYNQWLIIKEFIEYCKQNSYFDVYYVWYKLMTIGVHFVYYRYKSNGPSNTRSVDYYLFNSTNSSVNKCINELKKSIDSHIETLQTNHDIYIEFKDKVFDGNEQQNEDKPNVITHEVFKDSTINITKLMKDVKNNRHFRTRGRPSKWMSYRTESTDINDNHIIDVNVNDLNLNVRKVNIKKKAIKSKEKAENDTQILWTEDIIGSLKKVKHEKKVQKKCQNKAKRQQKNKK